MKNRLGGRLTISYALLFALICLPVCAFSLYYDRGHEYNFADGPSSEGHQHNVIDMPSDELRLTSSAINQPFVAQFNMAGMAQKDAAPEIYAASAIVINAATGEVLFEKESDTMRAPASMTKVMTAYLIFEEIEAGRLSLDTNITISSNISDISQNPSYPAMVYLRAGSQVSVDTLLKLILLPSASASCIAMAEHISESEAAFVERMNETAKALGIDAQYSNCHGATGNSVSARAQATLTQSFLQRFPKVLEYTSLKSVYFNNQTYYNSNRLLQNSYYYEGVDGFKTGTTTNAGFCLTATATSGEQRLITVIMKSLSDNWRFTDTKALIDFGFARAFLKSQSSWSISTK